MFLLVITVYHTIHLQIIAYAYIINTCAIHYNNNVLVFVFFV